MLVRFVAVALIGWAAVDLALYWLVCGHRHEPMKPWTVAAKTIPFFIGVAALIKAKALAEWISNILDG